MPKIFISYRREDAKYPADRLHAALKKHVANPKRDIFIDIDNIPAGVNFVQHLDNQVSQCDILLALIGPGWLTAVNPKTGKRRLDDPKDFVRVEIASALKRNIQVAPILLDGAPVPSEDELPDDLKQLAFQNGVEIRRETFDTDADRMIRKLDLRRSGATALSGPTSSRGSAAWIAPLLPATLLALAGGGAWVWFARPFDAARPKTAETATLGAAPSSLAAAPTAAAAPATESKPATAAPVLSAEVHDALMTVDVARVASALKRGWDANSSLDSESNTALHNLMLVCERNPGHDQVAVLQIAKLLVDAGAKPDQRNRWGDTPLAIARTPKYCGPNHPVTKYLETLAATGPAAN